MQSSWFAREILKKPEQTATPEGGMNIEMLGEIWWSYNKFGEKT
ncbi:hypothetical protein L8C07_01790 [Paenibacillus sp. CMAA1739]|nr:hypothetical protein [Paenibacillus sp. CMAA1739]